MLHLYQERRAFYYVIKLHLMLAVALPTTGRLYSCLAGWELLHSWLIKNPRTWSKDTIVFCWSVVMFVRKDNIRFLESFQRYLGCTGILKWISDITVYLPSERRISWHYLRLNHQRSFMTKSSLQTFLIQRGSQWQETSHIMSPPLKCLLQYSEELKQYNYILGKYLL